MSMERRLQVLLDEERYRKVSALAKARGMSVGAVVREAIDRGLVDPDARRAAAGRRLLAAEPMPVPSPDELKAELNAMRGRHG